VVRIRRALPRRVAAVLGRALAASLYVAWRCRDGPRWRVRAWEALRGGFVAGVGAAGGVEARQAGAGEAGGEAPV